MATTLTKAVQRIMKKDIPSVDNDDMKSNGIYYFPDESDVMKGLALIVGPPNTPYEGGSWFFSIEFNSQHPFEPPKVLSLTQDGKTRFNPNMYREGKVCLSLLGTWHQGDKWSSVQTLGSVLLSILGLVLNEEPLRNEPCYADFKVHPSFGPYNRMVLHANIETILRFKKMIPSFIPADHIDEVKTILQETFEKTKESLATNCRDLLAPKWDGKTEEFSLFKMKQTYHFNDLAKALLS